MKKKFLLVFSLLFVAIVLVGCNKTSKTKPTTLPTSSKTTSSKTTSTSSKTSSSLTTTRLNIVFTGLDEITTEEKKTFNYLEGVKAMGSDNVDYTSKIKVTSNNPAIEIGNDGIATTFSAGKFTLTYTVIQKGMVFTETRTVVLSRIKQELPDKEYTLIEGAVQDGIFATPYVLGTTEEANKFWYWTENASLATFEVKDNALEIVESKLGSVPHAVQVLFKSNNVLSVGLKYYAEIDVETDVDRVIDVVSKNPVNNYDLDEHHLLDTVGGQPTTLKFEFKAQTPYFYMNFMLGLVAGNETNFGTTKIKAIRLYNVPVEPVWEEIENYFPEMPTSGALDSIKTGTQGTDDKDYDGLFYEWHSDSAQITGEYNETGLKLNVPKTGGSDDWEVQVQFNYLVNAEKVINRGTGYKLTFKINSTVARQMKVVVTRMSETSSGEKLFDLEVGDNEIEVSFTSLYSVLMFKIMLGVDSLADNNGAGEFIISDLHLYEDKAAADPFKLDKEAAKAVDDFIVASEADGLTPVEIVAVRNKIEALTESAVTFLNAEILARFVAAETDYVASINEFELGETLPMDGVTTIEDVLWEAKNHTGEWFIWVAQEGWNCGPTAALESGIVDNKIFVDITGNSDRYWGVQLKYSGFHLEVGKAYLFSCVINSSVARTISIEGYGDIELVVGENKVELLITAQKAFNDLQFNLGPATFGSDAPAEAIAASNGRLEFTNFVIEENVYPGITPEKDFNLPYNNGDPKDTWYIWACDPSMGWPSPDQITALTAKYVATSKTVVVDLTQPSVVDTWTAQLKYIATDLVPGQKYIFAMVINASEAGHEVYVRVNKEKENDSLDKWYTTVVGNNVVEVTFIANEETTFEFGFGKGEKPLNLTFGSFEVKTFKGFDESYELKVNQGDPVSEWYVWACDASMGWPQAHQIPTLSDMLYDAETKAVKATLVKGTTDAAWNGQLKYRTTLLDLTPGLKYTFTATLKTNMDGQEGYFVVNKGTENATGDQNYLSVEGEQVITFTFVANSLFELEIGFAKAADGLMIEVSNISIQPFVEELID